MNPDKPIATMLHYLDDAKGLTVKDVAEVGASDVLILFDGDPPRVLRLRGLGYGDAGWIDESTSPLTLEEGCRLGLVPEAEYRAARAAEADALRQRTEAEERATLERLRAKYEGAKG